MTPEIMSRLLSFSGFDKIPHLRPSMPSSPKAAAAQPIGCYSRRSRYLSVYCNGIILNTPWLPLRRLDAFVMGAGTGGCLAGVSTFLRRKGCHAKLYLVDPPGSALFNRVRYGVCYSSQMSEKEVRKHR